MAMAGPGVDMDEEDMIFPVIQDPDDTVTQQKDTAKELQDNGGGFFVGKIDFLNDFLNCLYDLMEEF